MLMLPCSPAHNCGLGTAVLAYPETQRFRMRRQSMIRKSAQRFSEKIML